MRRRQINKLRAEGFLPPVGLIEREAWERERAAKAVAAIPPRPSPGQCRYCGMHIGKGVHFHERVCRG
jgi:hypothetical protein